MNETLIGYAAEIRHQRTGSKAGVNMRCVFISGCQPTNEKYDSTRELRGRMEIHNNANSLITCTSTIRAMCRYRNNALSGKRIF